MGGFFFFKQMHQLNVIEVPGEAGGGIKRNRDIQHVEIKFNVGMKSGKYARWIGHGCE